jgi:hypothetical protein
LDFRGALFLRLWRVQVQWVLKLCSVELLLLRSRPLLGLFLDTLAGYLLHLGYFDSRHYSQGTKAMVPLGLLGRFVVVQRNLGAGRLLSSMCLVRVVQVVLVGYGSFVKPGIVRPSTRVRTTRC